MSPDDLSGCLGVVVGFLFDILKVVAVIKVVFCL